MLKGQAINYDKRSGNLLGEMISLGEMGDLLGGGIVWIDMISPLNKSYIKKKPWESTTVTAYLFIVQILYAV